jgi:hypothetical protein
MKQQIKQLSPHQNGKVFGVLMAVSSLVFILPLALLMTLSAPQVDQHGNPVNFPTFMLVLMPVFYLVFGYLSVAIGCAIYNFIAKYIGGIEFVLEEQGE